jgi:hypothetical protein
MSSDVLRRRSSSRPRLKPLSPPPVFGQVQVVVEHFLGRAAAEVLHNAILLLTSLNTPIRPRCWHVNKHGASQEGFSPEFVERISLRSSRRAEGGGIMLFGSKSRFA